MLTLTPAEIERFWACVQRGPDCWLWTKELNGAGYGRFSVYRGGRRFRLLSHRVACALTLGNPDNAVVRHRCDNPPCCNPADLLLGTQADNMRDCATRGRTYAPGLVIGRQLHRAAADAMLAAGQKRCPGCGQVKPLDEFYRHSRIRHGRQSRCKACRAAGAAQLERHRGAVGDA